jgi:two-component system sensor histidine kinase AlgZ
MQSARAQDNLFLPDFCAIRVLFMVVLIGALLAILLMLAAGEGYQWLGLVSVYVQWIVLTDTLLLCLARPWLRRFDNRYASVLAFTLLQLVTLGYAGLSIGLFADFIATGAWEFVLRSLGVSLIVSAVTLRYFYVQHLWQAQLRAESEARIDALQARIRPHFLFNSMNAIAALTRSNPQRAESAIEDLAELFRFALGDPKRMISLADELAIARRYVEIEKLRLGDRLEVDWQVDPLPPEARVPALIIQPLVENAIYHGIEHLADGGVITIQGQRHATALELRICNPFPEHASAAHERGNRLALDNIRARIAAIYKEQSKVTVVGEDGQYCVTLYWPQERTT